MQDLISLVLIWICVFLSSWCAKRTHLTSVLFFLFFGALLVNVGLLPEESSSFIEVFSEIGIIVIMFALGFEESTSKFLESVRRSWGIALFGAIAPFVTAYSLTYLFWRDPNLSLICGLAMTATAVSLTMVVLKSEGLHSSRAATGIMTSAILDDIATLALVAAIIPIATGEATLSPIGLFMILGKVILFFALVVIVSNWIFPGEIRTGLMQHIPIIRRYGIQHVLAFDYGQKTTLTILLVALSFGLLAHYFGFHPAVGAYMAGLIIKEEYFHLGDIGPDQQKNYESTKKTIDDIAFTWLGPVFFVELGTKLIFDLSIILTVMPYIVILTTALFTAQIASAALAARYTGNFKWSESMMIGFGMLGRAELAFVVMDIAYVQYHIMSTEAFYTLMGVAFGLNVSVPICIKLWKPFFQSEEDSD